MRRGLVIAALVIAVAGVIAASVPDLRRMTPLLMSSTPPPKGHYSVHQVELAFSANRLPLRNVSPKAYGGLLAFLDGRPSHPIFVYVSVEACKCELKPALRNANVTRHGNVEVLWRDGEKSAVRAALRELG